MVPITEHFPSRQQLTRGLMLAAVLWILFLILTSWTSATTVLDRVDSTEMTKAASSDMWTGKVAYELVAFLVTQVLLHMIFAGLTWALACATAIVSTTARNRFNQIVVGWFCLLAGAALIYNALWFPRTLIGAYYHNAVSTHIGAFYFGQVAYVTAFAAGLFVTVWAGIVLLVRSASGTGRKPIWAGLALLCIVITALLASGPRSGLASDAESNRPHVILLGIDSLRLEQLRRYGGTGVTPNLDRFLSDADMFMDTTTPAARTFSSWMAILTGRAPVVTNARFNLAERSSLKTNPTLADFLHAVGYHTIYSTDEVRFANIDESYGFDQIVTPPIGASDFLIGTYNELPLASLIVNTRVGKWLFPYSHANRGAATMYQPKSYLDRLQREVSFERPTFFIAHLTAAHWPYYTSETPFEVAEPTPENQRPLYRMGLQTADKMFGELLRILARKGALRNALVIVLSDHGEAMGLPSDSFFDKQFHVEGLRAPFKLLDFGHGQSVLSKSQYQVLLAFKPFGGPQHKFRRTGRSLLFPSTVEDISPTILDFLGVAGDPLSATGQSLLPILVGGDDQLPDALKRVRFTETDLAVLPTPNGGVDEIATARRNSIYYEVDPETGRMHIRPTFAPLVATFKERAAFTPNQILAAIPAGPYAHQYVFLDFAKQYGRLLMGRPGDESSDAQRLWDALSTHFQGELKSPVSITSEDWARHDEEWASFIEVRRTGNPAIAASQPGAGRLAK